MARPPAETEVARIECPSCKKTVVVMARFAIKTKNTEPALFTSGLPTLGVSVVLQGIQVSHDCRRDQPEGEEPDANTG